ncbi:hypothetical protein [Flavimaricola marinus]|uniref:Uncharacterized protein n=1 Tax=Flavimaricola marinus TaxID=1819565 RepID=A0A238LG90_9RHOB|nr:hypothetical protein [Flavimaricola marinus]SMY08425.1 hypothetical protein LOM8899_02576 [Flavimaricola marinus]
MSDVTLTKTHILEGVWEGVLARSGGGDWQPGIAVLHEGKPLSTVDVTELEPGRWQIRVSIPPETISDGLQTFVVTDAATGEKLETFALLAGEALSHDIRAEISLLRAELDMLKRAFRRHCLETMG